VGFCDDAEVVVVAFGSPARFVRWVVAELRAEGHRVGYVRPITLWPFPVHAVRAATGRASTVAVFEINAGQMIDDVRLAVLGRAPVHAIGGISHDHSGFGVGPALTVEHILARIRDIYPRAAA
jgi:2-oxoglutarate ferredoxin oxidoreductase subunit alpha